MIPTVTELLHAGSRALEGGSESARLDAELLLGKVLGTSRSGLIARGTEPVAADHARAFAGLIDQRRRGAPVAYLIGMREFWSLPLTVSPAVLVPRPETELLVELALERVAPHRPCGILDLGTGSGAIALALAKERPRARVVGVDLSADALEVARQNSRALGLSRIDWRLGCWFDALSGERFDLIAANPPYVAADDQALRSLAAEPRLALTPGPSGLEALSAIAAGAPAHLEPGGWLLLEHGAGQAAAVRGLLERNGFQRVATRADLADRPRVTLGRRRADSLSDSTNEDIP